MFYAGMAYAVGKFASGRVGICRLYWFLALFRPFDSFWAGLLWDGGFIVSVGFMQV